MSLLPMSKPTMKIIYLVLLTLSYNQLRDQSRKFVKADETLIQVECHNAEVPEVCIQCLESDPRSKTADKVGIAEIVVGCLSSHAQLLLANVTDLASKTKDQGYKTALGKCGEAISIVERDLNQAAEELKNGEYDKAESWVSGALVYEVHCDDIFGRYKSRLPETVVYEISIYEELSEAANRIIERL